MQKKKKDQNQISLENKSPTKLIIGRQDVIDLPELELFKIAAKIDTGAYSCSLHCHILDWETTPFHARFQQKRRHQESLHHHQY